MPRSTLGLTSAWLCEWNPVSCLQAKTRALIPILDARTALKVRLGRVLINAQVESPLSGANRKTFARSELYQFRPKADIEKLKIPQCGGLLAHRVCYCLDGSTEAAVVLRPEGADRLTCKALS